MKINFERDANGEIISLETITEKEGILSDGERAQLQMFYDYNKKFKTLKEKRTHEEISKAYSKASKPNDKKFFICRICSVTNYYDYFILAENAKEAKEILTKHSPLMSDDIYCTDIETIKEDMIKANDVIKKYGL